MNYNSTNDYTYDTSDVKVYIDNWASTNFINDELKTIDGYSARLMTLTEYNNIPNTYSWRAAPNAWYWLMNSNSYVGCGAGYVAAFGGNYCSSKGGVRPVINVYKSALETNNNE